MKLTKTLVEAARPRAQRYRLNDSLVPGLCLLVLPSGALGKSSMVCHNGRVGSDPGVTPHLDR